MIFVAQGDQNVTSQQQAIAVGSSDLGVCSDRRANMLTTKNTFIDWEEPARVQPWWFISQPFKGPLKGPLKGAPHP